MDSQAILFLRQALELQAQRPEQGMRAVGPEGQEVHSMLGHELL